MRKYKRKYHIIVCLDSLMIKFRHHFVTILLAKILIWAALLQLICTFSRNKEEIKQNIWPEIPYDLTLWRRPGWQTLSKALDILSATVWVAQDLLKALAILSDKVVRGSAVDCKDLKNHNENQQKGHISLGNKQSYYLRVFQRLY